MRIILYRKELNVVQQYYYLCRNELIVMFSNQTVVKLAREASMMDLGRLAY